MKTIIVSDLHIGKIEHFRKSGIPVPAAAGARTTDLLLSLYNTLIPDRVVFLGDLFHSLYNSAVEGMHDIFAQMQGCEIILIAGNHDILSPAIYSGLGIDVVPSLQEEDVWFTHEPHDDEGKGFINICGHVHPSVQIRGKGRQVLTLPCFYQTSHQLILPAFGYFTGKSKMPVYQNARIFAIAGDSIFPIHQERYRGR